MRLGRFQFLIGGFLLHALGVVMALYQGAKLNITALVWGQIAITSIQLMTHYANDCFDLRADIANQTPTHWSGGSRVLVEHRLHPRTALVTALAFAGIATAAILFLSLVVRRGAGTFLLMFSALCLAWFYSAPPLRLHSRGWGELTTAIVVTLLTPLTGCYLQAGALSPLPFLVAVPLCCFQVSMLLAIEFPDANGDRQVNKRTLVVRLGALRAICVYVVLLVLAYALLPVLMSGGLPAPVALASVLVSPIASLLLWRAAQGDWHNPARWNEFGFYTILLLMSTTTADVGAFLWLIGTR